jgi:hypothetical protein
VVIKTFRAVRPLKIGSGYREPGQLVPEAVTWPIVESVLRTGDMEEVEINLQELSAAIQELCPDDAPAIYATLGVEPYDPGPVVGERKYGTKSSAPRPRKGRPNKAPILVEPPAPVEE